MLWQIVIGQYMKGWGLTDPSTVLWSMQLTQDHHAMQRGVRSKVISRLLAAEDVGFLDVFVGQLLVGLTALEDVVTIV